MEWMELVMDLEPIASGLAHGISIKAPSKFAILQAVNSRYSMPKSPFLDKTIYSKR
jgi:hypothetical protein